MTVFLVSGDNRRMLRALAADSIDAVVCDPPYGLAKDPDMTEVLTHWLRGDDYTASGGGFMGKTWDSFVPGPATWREVFRVVKPGGHVIMFSGTRTWDIATLALRLAGFEIRDGLMWLYGSGFPKSMDVSKAIDKAAGAEREKVAIGDPIKRMIPGADQNKTGSWIKDNGREYQPGIELPATPEAGQWDGWGTALKPAWEPIVLARKPIRGTVAANVLAYGTGAINIDATRIATTDKLGGGAEGETRPDQKATDAFTRPWMEDPEMQAAHAERVRANVQKAESIGRFPANIVLSHTEACVLTGTRKIKAITGTNSGRGSGKYAEDSNVYGTYAGRSDMDQGAPVGLGDADGMETVEVWECTDDCPVRILDEQTGTPKSAGRFPANVVLSHTEACVRLGARVIQSGAQTADRPDGPSTPAWDGAWKAKAGSSIGMEEVEVWECVEDCPVKLLDDQTGILKSGAPAGGVGNPHMAKASVGRGGGPALEGSADGSLRTEGVQYHLYGDSGGASRFFYCAKVAKKERNQGMPAGLANNHPTVKPIALMQWLIKLVTPPGATVLDPFCGSGSTGVAAVRNGYSFVGLDDDPVAIAIARYRLLHEGHGVETLGRVATDDELERAK